MIRSMPVVLALFALFIFPWQVSLLAVLGASLFVPPAGVVLGLIADLVYYTPGASFLPYFSICGVICSGIAYVVQRFVKARIIRE